jgi:hypothetical protein
MGIKSVTQLAISALFRRLGSPLGTRYLVIKTDIMHIVVLDKGKPGEKRGRKTTGLRESIL